MIDGLKLTMSGDEIWKRLEERIRCHERSIERWKRELARKSEEETKEKPLVPGHICENEVAEYEWRIEVLEFIRDRIQRGEVYQLGPMDLEFGELLPERPGWMQGEYDARNGTAFNLERLTRELDGFTFGNDALATKD